MLSIQHRDRAADIAFNFLSRHHHQLVITEQGQESFLARHLRRTRGYLVRRHLAQQADVGDLFFPDMFGQERQYSRQRHKRRWSKLPSLHYSYHVPFHNHCFNTGFPHTASAPLGE